MPDQLQQEIEELKQAENDALQAALGFKVETRHAEIGKARVSKEDLEEAMRRGHVRPLVLSSRGSSQCAACGRASAEAGSATVHACSWTRRNTGEGGNGTNPLTLRAHTPAFHRPSRGKKMMVLGQTFWKQTESKGSDSRPLGICELSEFPTILCSNTGNTGGGWELGTPGSCGLFIGPSTHTRMHTCSHTPHAHGQSTHCARSNS